MANDNALYVEEDLEDDSFDSIGLDELEAELSSQIEQDMSELEFLEMEKNKIGSPDELGKMIKDVVWEQFCNQIGVNAGETFIKENNGLHLDLRNEAHIQTTENFAKGNIATHNTEIDYQKRYDDWQSNFMKDSNGNVVTHKTRSGRDEATLTKGARKPYDEGRPKGSTKNNTDMDHTVSAGEIIRDAEAGAHLTQEEKIAFANSDKNLNEMNSSHNRSKGDKSMSEWLDNPNSKGQKPREALDDLDANTEKRYRKKDKEAREEYERVKKEGERRSIEAGKKSQRQEAFRIGKNALKAVLMQLLADLVHEIISQLVVWFKSAQKKLGTLIESVKEAIHNFIGKMKQHLVNAGNTLLTTIATAIIGPVVGTIKKVWMVLKQGWNSLKKAVDYIKDPANKNQPISILMMKVGEILIAGLTATGAIFLGEAIEKGLLVVAPGIFGVQIPLLGSVANILGIFLGAVIAGILGALAINTIEKYTAKHLKAENNKSQAQKANEILAAQEKLLVVNEVQLEKKKIDVEESIVSRHNEAKSYMRDAYSDIMEDFVTDFPDFDSYEIIDEDDVRLNKEMDEIGDELDDLLSDLM